MYRFLPFVSVSVIFLFITAKAHAVNVCPGGNFSSLCDIQAADASDIVGNIINILLIIAVIVAIIFIIWGGVKWITSSGDKSKVEGARSTITGAVIGLILAFLAFFIVNLVSFFFGVENGTKGFELPRLIDGGGRKPGTPRQNDPPDPNRRSPNRPGPER